MEYINQLKFKKISIIFLLFCALILTGQGCVSVRFGAVKAEDGGSYVSEDRSETWKQKAFVAVVKNKTQTNSFANINKYIFHPLDSKIIYAASTNAGLWVSADAGESWKTILTSSGSVQAIGLDVTSTQILYIGIGGQISKTIDGGNTWTVVYTQSVAGYTISSLAVDPFNPRNIYAGTSNGNIIKSDDSGASWKTLTNQIFQGEIRDIIFHPSDANFMLAVTPASGIFRSMDRGLTWQDFIFKETIQKFPGSINAGVILPHFRNSSIILYSSGYGIMRTNDGGATWIGIKLLTKPGEINILSMIANPYDFDEIYYGTASNMYKTFNSGVEWVTRSLPSSRLPTALAINPNDATKIWMGTTKPIPKKKNPLSPF